MIVTKKNYGYYCMRCQESYEKFKEIPVECHDNICDRKGVENEK